ncbi:DUF202 domain-containing protein [Streptomyces sp. TS71-3]|uniref:DUF202 domain-containing protein n=1 Tax=Streptomyces sp. TS71-3 TaxID=2733862 RepID=UPI001B17467B|nr:DUF202 domain-containing protein [Streptomyces sp. TS71-3]GHJ38650.1 hypothetical protein Sm713_42590 [Streptomyces sp. TS71-3]
MSGPRRDPGLQPERTRLAWRRTTLTCTVTAVLAVKATLRDGTSVVPWLLCALCVGLWMAFIGLSHRRIRLLSSPGSSAAPGSLSPGSTGPPASSPASPTSPGSPSGGPLSLDSSGPPVPRSLAPRLALAAAACTTAFALCAAALLL